jgi:rubrerythrin
MAQVSRTVDEAIKKAIKLEIDGKAFFNHAAEVTESERGKKMFLWLANEEVKHLEVFGKLFSRILKSDDWKKYVSEAQLSRKGEAPLITKLKESMKKKERKGGKGEVDAIRIGMELEQNAIQFFQEAAGETDDTNAAKIFSEIAEEEKFHFDMLQAQYDSVSGSGFWLGSAEFRMDGKW